MKKAILIMCVGLLLVVLLIPAAYTANVLFEESDISIIWGYEGEYQTTLPVYSIGDRTYVPLRDFCSAFRMNVIWREDENEAWINSCEKPIPVGKSENLSNKKVLPDEETALQVGKILLEKYAGRSYEYETEDRIYYLKCYSKTEEIWQVYQECKNKETGRDLIAIGVPQAQVQMSKATGEVLYVNTVSYFESDIEIPLP